MSLMSCYAILCILKCTIFNLLNFKTQQQLSKTRYLDMNAKITHFVDARNCENGKTYQISNYLVVLELLICGMLFHRKTTYMYVSYLNIHQKYKDRTNQIQWKTKYSALLSATIKSLMSQLHPTVTLQKNQRLFG